MSKLYLQSLISNVATLNNQAVTQIHSGEYVSAISSLSLVFNVCKELLSCCRVSGQTNDTQNGDSRAFVAKFCYTFSSEVEDSVTRVPNNNDGTDSLFFCRRLLMLVDPSTAATRVHLLHERNPGEEMTAFAEFATYAIIYNLALCHHLQADMSPLDETSLNVNTRTRSKSLKRAVALYSFARDALNLVLENGLHEASSIHYVVLLNNMLQASQTLGDKEAARKFLHSLARTTMAMLVLQRRKRALSMPNEIDEFVRVGNILDRIAMNLTSLLFGLRGCWTAPAA